MYVKSASLMEEQVMHIYIMTIWVIRSINTCFNPSLMYTVCKISHFGVGIKVDMLKSYAYIDRYHGRKKRQCVC